MPFDPLSPLHQRYPSMEWIESTPPRFVGHGDVWKRPEDNKRFYAQTNRKLWVSIDGETIPFAKNSYIFKS